MAMSSRMRGPPGWTTAKSSGRLSAASHLRMAGRQSLKAAVAARVESKCSPAPVSRPR